VLSWHNWTNSQTTVPGRAPWEGAVMGVHIAKTAFCLWAAGMSRAKTPTCKWAQRIGVFLLFVVRQMRHTRWSCWSEVKMFNVKMFIVKINRRNASLVA
jgi:hypothetical protein